MASNDIKSCYKTARQMRGIAGFQSQVSKRRNQRYEIMKAHISGLPDITVSSRSDSGSFYRKVAQALSRQVIDEFEKELKKMPLGDRTSTHRKWQLLLKQLGKKEEDIVKLWNLFMRSKETTKVHQIMNEEYMKKQSSSLNLPNGQISKSKSCNNIDESTETKTSTEEVKLEIPLSAVKKMQANINNVISNIEWICNDRAVQERSKVMNSLLFEILDMLDDKNKTTNYENPSQVDNGRQMSANNSENINAESKNAMFLNISNRELTKANLLKMEKMSDIVSIVQKTQVHCQQSEVDSVPDTEEAAEDTIKNPAEVSPPVIKIEQEDKEKAEQI